MAKIFILDLTLCQIKMLKIYTLYVFLAEMVKIYTLLQTKMAKI